jgi:hypothetical protein
LFATFGNGLADLDALSRAREDEDIWCAPEVLRSWAHGLIVGGREPEQANAEAVLVRSLDIARRQDAKAWELRTATTLASFYGASGRFHEARSALEPAFKHFSQGIGTRDVEAATKVLSELAAPSRDPPRSLSSDAQLKAV